MKYKSFNEFWAKFLQVTFHLENPDRWSSRKRKADWFLKYSEISEGARILDLGCGDGLIDIWLARMGFVVTAVDRSASVLINAKEEDNTKSVDFVVVDLRQLKVEPKSFDAILFIESVGLMNQHDDANLIKNAYDWLTPAGTLIIDCCESAETTNSWKKQFANGEVSVTSSFDLGSRMQRINFLFTDNSGETFGLLDPIRDNIAGISRYLYPKQELTLMLSLAGFEVREVPHYYEKNYYSLAATKRHCETRQKSLRV
jgi:SAM-dependent methyltransferase